MDWTRDPDGLRRGEISSLPDAVASALRRAAAAPEVVALARRVGADPLAVAVALLAGAEPGHRGAARIFRAVLGRADAGLVEAARRAVGL